MPKRLALNNPEGIAARVAGPMSRIAAAGSPLVRPLSASTDAMLRLLGVRQRDDSPFTADEVGVLLEQGARAGAFEMAKQEMVEAVVYLTGDPVATHMTPPNNVVGSISGIQKTPSAEPFSMPVTLGFHGAATTWTTSLASSTRRSSSIAC